MKITLAIEWNDQVGIHHIDILKLNQHLVSYFVSKEYGEDINEVMVGLVAGPFLSKHRKFFRKTKKLFFFDVIVDFIHIRESTFPEKKLALNKQFIESAVKSLEKYDFDNFEKDEFLKDWIAFFEQVEW